MSGGPRVCIVSASRQNVFFSEILNALAGMLREAGVTVEEAVDCFPPPADDLVYLNVPHEYHALVDDLAHPTPDQLRRTVIVSTEQPGTEWFELAAGISANAGAVLDINTLGVQELRARGIAADHLPLGYVPEWDAWGGDDERERPLDLVFLGGYTDRRGRVLAHCAPHLVGRRAAVKLTETDQPHSGESADYWSGRLKWEKLAEANLMLNVHRSAVPYLEWHRTLGALMNGCVLLTEHSIGVDPLVPGEHYVSAGYWQLPEVLGALLEEPDRVQWIRRQAYALVREEMPVQRSLERLTAAVDRTAQTARLLPATNLAAPQPVAMPLPVEKAKPPWQEYAEHAGPSLATRMGLKHVLVRMNSIEQNMEQLLGSGGGKPEQRVVGFGPPLEHPKVSVVLTVHNYADFVGDAIRSVALSSLREVEVVAVDDASSDCSVAAVEAACGEFPWLSLTHVRLSRNRGLPAARNLAVDHARADLLFVLDADNEVMPDGLKLLTEALDKDPDAAFAYGIVQSFDAEGPADLMNWLPWDPIRLRRGNYIDAMAMLRRTALTSVGAYTADPALYGWEDYALWLALAERGYEGVNVADFVGRYRKSPHSMISLANVDVTAAWGALLRRHPQLAVDPA